MHIYITNNLHAKWKDENWKDENKMKKIEHKIKCTHIV